MGVVPADLLEFERPLLSSGQVVVGIDEVGRGALAGPLVVGAVVLRDLKSPPEGLTDSKALSAARRESLIGPLEEWADGWALGWVEAAEIDAWGIRLALSVAADRALSALTITPTHALVDGSFNLLRAPRDVAFGVTPPVLSHEELAVTTLVKGDARSATIAAASVLAKVARDASMVERSTAHPLYGWHENKGYGSATHLAALETHGACDEHRRSWNLPGL